MRRFTPLVGLCLLMAFGRSTYGRDWPTRMHDNCRSGVTDARLELPLRCEWTFKTMAPPSPAWPAPASSGCTCGFSLQTSLAYIPESRLQ
jgi:hypothetical protein